MPLWTIDEVPFFQPILHVDTNRLHIVWNWTDWQDDLGEEYLVTLCGQRIWRAYMDGGHWTWKKWSEILEEFVRTFGRPKFAMCRACGGSRALEVVEGLVALARGTSTKLRQVVHNRKGEF